MPGGGGAAVGGRSAVAALAPGGGRLVPADGKCPQMGRAFGSRTARRAQGGAVRSPRARGRAGVGAGGGLENIPAVVAAAASLRAVRAEAVAEAARLRELTERIRVRVPELVPDVEVVGDAVHRLPGIVAFSCLYVDGETLLHELDRAGFSVSSGSSCTSSTLTPSHVLKAMGVLSEGNVRVSLPPGTPSEDVDRLPLSVLPDAVAEHREKLGAPTASAPPSPSPSDSDTLRGGLPRQALPIPVIELAKVIGDVPVGGTVRVLSDDEAARLDIPAWCEMRGHEYVGEERADHGFAYVVRRVS